MAAGLGFKDFQTGEVLTAADVDGYLMQGIWVFTNTTARDAAVTSPQEGNFAFTKDTNSLWYYDGAAWVASGATGDIEGVTAGIGISGGGTSGTVTVTNSMATAIDAKGDLVAGTGADTFAKLTVGANNTVLTADSAEATGLKWAAAAAGASYAVFRDEKSSGTNGGTQTSGSFLTRDLNTTQFNNITGASLSSNQVTLAAGTYFVMAIAPHRGSGVVSRWYNITDSAVAVAGQTNYMEAWGETKLFGYFTIAAQKVFELQYRATQTEPTDGLGVNRNFSIPEVYSMVHIVKVA